MERPSESTVKTLISENRAKLMRVFETRGSDTAFIRFWEGIQKDQLDACRRYLISKTSAFNNNDSVTVENPKASNDVKTGVWYGGPVEDRLQDDGTYIIVQTLFRDGLVISDIIAESSCRFLVERTLYLKSPTRPTIPPRPHPKGVSYRVSEIIVDGQSGTFTGWVDKRTQLYQDTGTYITEESIGRETTRREQTGVTDQNIPDISTPEVGKVKSQTISLNDNCSIDATTIIQKSKELGVESSRIAKLQSSISTGKKNSKSPPAKHAPENGEFVSYDKTQQLDGSWDWTERIDVSPVLARHNDRLTKLGGSTGTGTRNDRTAKTAASKTPDTAETITFSSQQNPDETWDWDERIDIAPELERGSSRKTVKGGSESTGARNDPSGKPVPTTPLPGQTITSDYSQNEDDTWNWDERIDERSQLSGKNNRYTPTSGKTTGTRERGVIGRPPEPASPLQGQIIFFTDDENDDGTWETTTRIDESSPLIGKGVVKTTKRRSVETVKRNQRVAEPPEPNVIAGKRLTWNIRQNEDNTWDETTRIDEVVDNISVSGGVVTKCGVIAADNVQVGLTTRPDNPTAPDVAGVKRTWSIRESDDGSFEMTIRDEIAPSRTSNGWVRRKYGSVTDTIKRNFTGTLTVPPAPETVPIGHTISLRQDQNLDCSWDETLRDEESPELERIRQSWRQDYTLTASGKINARAKEENNNKGDDDVLEISNDENADGTWNTLRQLRSPKSQSTQWKSYADRGGTSYSIGFSNLTDYELDAIIGAMDSETNNSLTIRKNEFGRFDGGASRQHVADGGLYALDTGIDFDPPVCQQGRKFTYAKAKIRYSTIKAKIDQILNTSLGFGVAIDFGAGQATGTKYLGRGRYRVCRVEGSNNAGGDNAP